MRGGWSTLRGCATALVAAVAGATALSEFAHWRASRREVHPACGPAGSEAIVVLGFPAKRNGRPHALQRWRCEIAVRSLDPDADGVVVFTGAAVGRPWSEAEVMSRYARDALGLPGDRIVVETRAENTWHNVEYTIPLIEHADRVKIASDPLHAARARRYLRAQRPDLAARVVAAADYRLLERWWLKIPTAAAAVLRRLLPRRR